MSDIKIEDIKQYLQGKQNTSLLYVKDYKDITYKTVHKVCRDILPTTEDNMYDVGRKLPMLIDSLRYMEPNDYNSIVNTFRKYEVTGSVRPISGNKTYGYDTSRLDSKMYKRKRSN